MNLEELEKLAKAATPGPWQSEAWDDDRMYSKQEVADLDYTAAANPQTVLKLIAVARPAMSICKRSASGLPIDLDIMDMREALAALEEE